MTTLAAVDLRIVLVEPRRMRDRAHDLLAEEDDLARALDVLRPAATYEFAQPGISFYGTGGVALGATNRRDGTLGSFVLGLFVIFAYYVIMFTAQSLTKGFWIPAWLSMWTPNIFLGIAGVMLLIFRARSADQPIRISLPRWFPRRRRSDDPADAPVAKEWPKNDGWVIGKRTVSM